MSWDGGGEGEGWFGFVLRGRGVVGVFSFTPFARAKLHLWGS